MSNIPIRYVAPFFDLSGYAVAARDYACAFIDEPDIDLTLSCVSFEHQHTTFGKLQEKFTPFLERKIKPAIQITHLTPENYPIHRHPDCYNICYTTWETDKLPPIWVDGCNSMDEVWVPSKWNKEIFLKSGISKPIYIIPHIVQEPDLSDAQYINFGTDENTYIFYSIFQWIARKNYHALLMAYFTEFKVDEDVCLALKTYRINTNESEQQIIKNEILEIKTSLKLAAYPSLRFFGNMFPIEYMKGFHLGGDCFVLPSRAEGFGIPYAQAMSYEKPVIGSNYGGNLDFMDEINSYLIDCREIPVYGMIFGQYNGTMNWGDPDVMHLKKLMRYVFEHKEEAREVGIRAKKSVLKQLSSNKIGKIMSNRLVQISKTL